MVGYRRDWRRVCGVPVLASWTETVLRPRDCKVCPHKGGPGSREIPGERDRQKTGQSCHCEAEGPCSHRCFSIPQLKIMMRRNTCMKASGFESSENRSN